MSTSLALAEDDLWEFLEAYERMMHTMNSSDVVKWVMKLDVKYRDSLLGYLITINSNAERPNKEAIISQIN